MLPVRHARGRLRCLHTHEASGEHFRAWPSARAAKGTHTQTVTYTDPHEPGPRDCSEHRTRRLLCTHGFGSHRTREGSNRCVMVQYNNDAYCVAAAPSGTACGTITQLGPTEDQQRDHTDRDAIETCGRGDAQPPSGDDPDCILKASSK